MKKIMKQKKKIILLLTITISLFMLAGSNTTLGSPSQTGECGLCHGTQGSMTLTSNATGTVNAIEGVPFALVFQAGGYAGGDLQFYIAMEASWADNGQFISSRVSVQDNSVDDSDATTNQITTSVSFTPTAIGTFSLEVWTAANPDFATFLIVAVSVSAPDTTPPTIDSPTDQNIAEGSTGNSITWDPQDSNPSSYDIYKDGTSVKSGAWNLTSETVTITVSVAVLPSVSVTTIV